MSVFRSVVVRCGLTACLVLLSACATNKTANRAGTAAATPLSDLNIMREEIPEVLELALKQPYLTPADQSCPAITTELHKLDAALGADLDAPASDEGPSLLERGTDAAENTAIGAIQRTAEGLIPFRSWVRKLSGAERYSRKVAAATTAGAIRRAFIKGIGVSHGCTWLPPLAPPSTAASASGASQPLAQN